MEKIKGMILNAQYVEFTDKKTGELVCKTMVNYVLETEDAEESVGYDLFKNSFDGNVVEKFKGKTMRNTFLGMRKVKSKAGYALRLAEVDGRRI